MKQVKKLFAIVIAMVMVVATMSITAFADDPIFPDGVTADTTITITGLEENDVVNLYKIIEWKNNSTNTSAGWALLDPFAGDAACEAVLHSINASVDAPYQLTQADVKAFTHLVSGATAVATATVDSSKTFSKTIDNTTVGMYMALVKPAVAGTLYNPIIVSGDFNDKNTTNSIDSSAILGSENEVRRVVKKETTTVTKEQEDLGTASDKYDNSYNVGDTVSFTVKTTIPVFADIYFSQTTPTFTVTDVLTEGLVLQTDTVKVYEEDGTTEITALTSEVTDKTATGWKLPVPPAYIQALGAPQNIVIKYDAVLTEDSFDNVNEEINEVTVEFSNNPNDTSEKGKIKDKTRTYTFSIDGNILGESGVYTSELIKVAVDGNGDPIMQESASGATYMNALGGAIFGLFPTKDAADAYTKNGKEITDKAAGDAAGMYTNSVFNGVVTSDNDGYLEINGLEEGTYFLKELCAPDGYVKDTTVHKIVITATYDEETITENGYTYTVPKLADYTITVDDADTSTYDMTLQGSDIWISSIDPSSSLLNNTKGVELPSTGGIGTTIFYVIGAILVLGAGILLVTRRRMDLG